MPKKAFAYRMCTGRPTSAMAKPRFLWAPTVPWMVAFWWLRLLMVMWKITWCGVVRCGEMYRDVIVVTCGEMWGDVMWWQVLRCGVCYQKCNSCAVKCFSALQSTTQYFSVLLSITKYYTVLQGIAPYYKLLLGTTECLYVLRIIPYYKVLCTRAYGLLR